MTTTQAWQLMASWDSDQIRELERKVAVAERQSDRLDVSQTELKLIRACLIYSAHDVEALTES